MYGDAIPRPIFNMQDYETRKRDEINFSVDATLRVNKAAGIYPKLKAFQDATTAYRHPRGRDAPPQCGPVDMVPPEGVL